MSEQQIRRSRDFLDFQTAVKDLLSSVECYGSTSAHLNEQFNGLAGRFNLPQYCWHWARGYRDCRIDGWYRNGAIVFCYVINGEIVEKSWDAMTEEQREFCRQGKNTVGGHWWADSAGKPKANHPFFVSRDTEKDPQTGHYPIDEVTPQFCAMAS